ncbi:ABC1 kinase family protein [Spirulina subsalsa]|uniref:ABC1 kinase family protein n=1 Tax=Spirulina subsalsa TaxID=54311 RepID=UPI0002D80ADC|nr:AarF/ABC1/UbiB kinase family protein [Spirulina subsalsa]
MSASSSLQPWQRRKYSPFRRQMDVFGATGRFLTRLWWDNFLGRNTPECRRQQGRKLVNQLLRLGPTFIKIGQALSTRSDLIPLEYTEALGELQDRVPEFDPNEAIAVIESELGGSIHTLFREFDRFPLAAASLGQVHRATLHTGELVVVKVQRPGLEELFNLDFEVIHRLVRILNRYVPAVRKYDLEALYNEFFGLLYQEIDYIHEGKNAERFRENFAEQPHILVPKVYWRYTSRRVLTLEYLPGIKIDDRQTIEACDINPDQLIQAGITCYLQQLLKDGFFQSDPHPGNMAVSQDGHLIFYDFGTMAEVKSMAQDQMLNTFFAVMKKDTEGVVSSLVYMGLLEPKPDMTPVKRLVSFVLDQFREKPIDLKAFEQMGSEVYAMFEQQPFRLPAQMMFIIKSVTTLDGIARALNPQYNLLAASTPFLKELTQSARKGSLVQQLAQQTKSYIRYRLTRPSEAERAIAQLENRIEQGELQFRVRTEASDRILKRIYLAIKSLIYACMTGFSLLCGTLLLLGNYPNWAIVLFSLASFCFFLLLRSLSRLAVRERLDKLVEK